MISFGTKAETLDNLKPFVRTAKILSQVRFTVGEWNNNQKAVITKLKKNGFLSLKLIVRSSAQNEDNAKKSQAGRYRSILNIRGQDQLEQAVKNVIRSYETEDPLNQIFIQPMIKNVKWSCVVFSKDPSTGGPYVVINYDDTSGSTSSITSGTAQTTKTFYYYRHTPTKLPDEIAVIAELVKELEKMLCHEELDIECAITENNDLYLLQVRPLVCPSLSRVTEQFFHKKLTGIENRVREMRAPHPYIQGTYTMFGMMPDWNPAEIIGVRPRGLALSLYKELVTDSIWAHQRYNYGYKNLKGFPLLISFCGLPYIDIRVDFNSFVPSNTSVELAKKLVKYYLDKLTASQNLHDKVEFEIVYSCYTFDLPEKLQTLYRHGFSKEECDELAENLRVLTNSIIDKKEGFWHKDRKKIQQLETRHTNIIASSLNSVSKLYWLIEDCKQYGTLPFAGLARSAFIAVQLLQSLVRIGILTDTEYENFFGSLQTTSSHMKRDFCKLDQNDFLKLYGHLRPGTYDILSARYDEDPERYFDWSTSRSSKQTEKSSSFSISTAQSLRIEKLLNKHKIDQTPLSLFDFIRNAIEMREKAKFVFTKSLSDILSLFGRLGKDYGFSLEDCSYADIKSVFSLYGSDKEPSAILGNSITKGKELFKLTKQITLPPLVIQPEDVWAFHLPPCDPNYVTQKLARGKVVISNGDKIKLRDNIVFIPSADPGYDWIFSHNVKGFVTMYGGANSHMAIRAVELGIPAIIGAGQVLYTQWISSSIIEIDCMNKQVRIIQ